MTAKTVELQRILRERGYSVTRQRLLLFEALTNQEPMTMHELYGHLQGKLDRASAYRTVSLFETLGIVRRINIGWKYKLELSDTFTEHHHHLSCLHCHRVVPINEEELEKFVAALAAKHDFIPYDHQIEIQGYCAACVSSAPSQI